MAAGGSAPQFFSTIVSLFFTKSNVGIATSIGSSFFNHLCICAAAVMSSKSGKVYIDKRILLRDCTFYIISLLILIWTLKGHIFVSLEPANFQNSCLEVKWEQALLLNIVWIVYALVCINHSRIVRFLCPSKYAKGLLN